NLQAIRKEMHEVEQKLGASDFSVFSENELLQKWNACHDELEKQGGYSYEHLFSSVLHGLHLEHLDLRKLYNILSGGEKRRVALAALLLSSFDLLILDEPTNHLDSDSISWLEEYLCKFSHAVIVISHDRMFINGVANQVVELSSETHKLHCFHGNYDSFLLEKKMAVERSVKAYEEKKEEIQKIKEFLKAKTFSQKKPKPAKDQNKMAYDYRGEHHIQGVKRTINQAKSKLEELEKEPLVHPRPKAYKGIFFEPKELSSNTAIELIDISKGCLFKEVSLFLNKGDRVVLTGANGSGKTTLLKMIMGTEKEDSGTITRAKACLIGFLDQELELLP